MKRIRIFEISLFSEKDFAITYYLNIDQERFDIVWDDENPQYVVVVLSHVIQSKELFDLFRRLYSKDRIVIFVGDECVYPDMNLCDYAVSYADDFSCADRVARFPLFWIHRKYIKKDFEANFDIESEYQRRRFCNFIYSNSRAHPCRDNLFFAINKYKEVESLGKHLRNRNIPWTRNAKDYFKISTELKSNYRFSIAAENDNFIGNTSEKILSSFYSHSVPIYWGNPKIAEEFNDAAFINCHDYSSFDEVVNRIQMIDNNRELWGELIRTPMFTDEQLKKHINEYEKYKTYIAHIFSQDIKDAKRITFGTAAQDYLDFWVNSIGWQRGKAVD